MSEKRFYKLNSRFVDIEEPVIYDNFEQKALNIEQSVELLNKLYEENEQLREINKELGDDLYNCRLNKNIIREKLKLWQDVHKEYGIYSIKDFEESFELDAKINKEKGI